MELFEIFLMEPYCVALCLLLIFPAMSVISRGWIKVFILLCCVAYYDKIGSQETAVLCLFSFAIIFGL